MGLQTRKIVYDFRGALSPPAVASRQGIWCSKATGSCTIASVSGGPIALALDATSEVQNACLYMGDILPFDIDDLRRVEFICKVTASLAAAVKMVFGVGTARNDDPDALASAALFTVIQNAVYCETDDAVTDKDDIATGDTLSTTYKRFVIDFAEGVVSKSPPALSVGGKASVGFYMGNANGSLRRVAANTQFDMSAFSSNLQLLAQVQKTSGTAVGTLSILEASVEYKLPC